MAGLATAAMEMSSDRNECVLILAPVGRDAALAESTLRQAGIVTTICSDIEQLRCAAEPGVGALLLTQEALSSATVARLLQVLQSQPPWSDLPLVVLVSGGASRSPLPHPITTLERQANVTVLERPVRASTLVNSVQVALRARRRQYELRDLLSARARAEEAERQARVTAEEAVRIRDEFLAAVAHDLKDPLGAIKGYAQLIQRRAAKASSPEAAKLGQDLAKIDTMISRAVAQVDELLDLARLQAGQPFALSLGATDLGPWLAAWRQTTSSWPRDIKYEWTWILESSSAPGTSVGSNACSVTCCLMRSSTVLTKARSPSRFDE